MTEFRVVHGGLITKGLREGERGENVSRLNDSVRGSCDSTRQRQTRPETPTLSLFLSPFSFSVLPFSSFLPSFSFLYSCLSLPRSFSSPFVLGSREKKRNNDTGEDKDRWSGETVRVREIAGVDGV